jgi:hypothetical protein
LVPLASGQEALGGLTAKGVVKSGIFEEVWDKAIFG